MFRTHLVQQSANTQQSFNSWPVSMQQPTSYSNAPVQSFSSMPIQIPKNSVQGQEKEDLMKSLMQQACLHSSGQSQKKMMTEIPGWTISPTAGNPNPGEPVIEISNLPAGSYFGKL